MNTHSMSIVEVRCDAVDVGERHRKDLGEIDVLAASIAAEGLLQPIGITEENVLVFGERRLRAFQDVLRRETIPARVVHVGSITAGEYAENQLRKDFTPSERVAIVEALRSFEHGGDRRSDQAANRQLERVKAEEAARKAGFDSERTYQRARQVVEHAVYEVIAQMDAEELSVTAAALIAEQPPERQREIVRLPEPERQEAVRKLRRKDLPTPAEAHRQAKKTGKAILDRNLEYQLPMSMEERRPLIEKNLAVMAVVDATRDIARCALTAADVAAGIREFDTPDMDFAGQCRKSAAFLQQINQELDSHATE
jgi:ParB-like chromosome segregation protein Spo0J